MDSLCSRFWLTRSRKICQIKLFFQENFILSLITIDKEELLVSLIRSRSITDIKTVLIEIDNLPVLKKQLSSLQRYLRRNRTESINKNLILVVTEDEG